MAYELLLTVTERYWVRILPGAVFSPFSEVDLTTVILLLQVFKWPWTSGVEPTSSMWQPFCHHHHAQIPSKSSELSLQKMPETRFYLSPHRRCSRVKIYSAGPRMFWQLEKASKVIVCSALCFQLTSVVGVPLGPMGEVNLQSMTISRSFHFQ